MKKLINTIVALLGISTLSLAGTPAPVVAPVAEPIGLTVKAFAASVIEDFDTYAIGGGLTLEVPLNSNLSLEVGGSVFEDEVYATNTNLLYYIPVADAFSVYAIGGGGYDFQTDQWVVGAGAGVKYALSPVFNVFADGIYNWTVEDSNEDGVVTARIGIGFSF